MPASSPSISPSELERLGRLGARLRALRKQQRVSAVSAAEAAGISRVTLHRIERGEASVTIGAWAAVAGALGVSLELADTLAGTKPEELPQRIQLADYPQLKMLAWQLHGADDVSPQEALSMYERNWRHVDVARLSIKERRLIEALSRSLGGQSLV